MIGIHELVSRIDKSSQFYGKLVNWSHGWQELNIWHYGIGLSDDAIFDTGRGMQIFTPNFTPKIVLGVVDIHFPTDQTIDRLVLAQELFSDWDYGLLGWNCEHLARLVATDDPVSYEVIKTPPPIPQLNGNGRNLIAKEIFQRHLAEVAPDLLTRDSAYRSRIIS